MSFGTGFGPFDDDVLEYFIFEDVTKDDNDDNFDDDDESDDDDW